MKNKIVWCALAALGCASNAPVSVDSRPPNGAGAETARPADALPTDEQARRFGLRRRLLASEEKPAPVDMEVLTLSGSSSFQGDRHSHLYALVLDGQVVVESDVSGERVTLQRWHALWAPGVGVRLQSAEAKVLVAFVGSEAGEWRYDGAAARGWKERPAPGRLQQRDLAAVNALHFAGGRMHARIGFETGPASMSLLYGPADIGVPPHKHDSSWEVIGLLSTSGYFQHAKTADGGLAGAPEHRIDSGMVVAVQPPLQHTFKTDKTKPLFAVQFYVPPGPEQRFKQAK